MAMMPHPRDRARSGWGTALGFPSSDPLEPRTSSLSWRVERPESGALWSDPPIDTILAEFTSRWERGDEPSIAEFLTRLGPARPSDAAALVYHAFCLAEAAGLNPDPASYVKRFPVQGALTRAAFLPAPGLRHVATPALGGPGDVARRSAMRSARSCCSASWARVDLPGCSWPSRRISTTASWSSKSRPESRRSPDCWRVHGIRTSSRSSGTT